MEQVQQDNMQTRMQAVAKLKRAASLPRMKDGRRPPMHSEAVSDGEKGASGESKKEDASPPEVAVEVPVEVELEAEVEMEEAERCASPGPTTRNKRRSRSRSRSRSSKDFKGKRAIQSPTPTSQLTGDSSPDEAPPPPQLNFTGLSGLASPLSPHILELQRLHLLRSPTPTSPDSSMFNSGMMVQSPSLLPSLADLRRGLIRSNSAGGSNTNRMLAMHILTGGTEVYDPSPLAGLSRNNTVTGGERIAARNNMISRLGGRITKEVDGDQASGEERTAPSPTPKRKRRRSRRGSASANTGISDSEFTSTSPNTPIVPPTPLPTSADALPDLRSRSTTPYQMMNLPVQDVEQVSDGRQEEPVQQHERLGPARRRSVVIEEDDEERYPPPRTYLGPPVIPPPRKPTQIAASRVPYVSDVPSNESSSDSTSPPAPTVDVLVLMGQRIPQHTPPGNDPFPRSPIMTASNEVSTQDDDDDEEQVLYGADTYRPRTPYADAFDREISWIASPVPELDIRIPVDDEEEEGAGDVELEGEGEPGLDDPPLSPRSSTGLSPVGHGAYNDISPRISSDSKSLVVESETSPIISTSFIPLSPSAAALSQTASVTRASDESTSSHVYPARLSVVSRSPMNGEFTDWDDRGTNIDTTTKRNGEGPSTWTKVKNTFSKASSSTGRRSRTSSIVTRERRDHIDSSISRESGASLTSAKADKVDTGNISVQPQALMQSPSASASILSLAPPPPARGGPSPIPPASPADMSKYQNAKLFPFPGIKKLEEQRNRAKGLSSASASSPDIMMMSSSNEEEFISSPSNASSQSPEGIREHKLSHQASDSLIAKINLPPSASASPHSGQDNGPPQSSSRNKSKYPTTLAGVKEFMKGIGSSQTSSRSASPAVKVRPPLSSHGVPSLPDILQRKNSEQLVDWEEIGTTPTSISGETFSGKPAHDSNQENTMASGSTLSRFEYTDMEKTPKAKKIMPPSSHREDISTPYTEESPSPSALPSRLDPFSSATPDPSSSLSDYPAHSTSESSSTNSSRYSVGHIGPQGPIILEKLSEDLARGSLGRISSLEDEPRRKLLLSSPVFQVVNNNTLKDRFLLLFNDILIIAKPVISDQDAFVDSYKPSPLDRKYIVKSVIMLNQLRFSADRSDPEGNPSNYSLSSRNSLVKFFILNFSRDPDSAINTLLSKSGKVDDPVGLGQLLFKTLDLDRIRLGEYLTKRTSKSVLKAYLDAFGFIGIRIDTALRVFLLSIHIPTRIYHHTNGLEYLLDAFAGRWYEANAKLVDYDKDCAHRLVRAIVQLNELLHERIALEPGPTGSPRREVTSGDFVDAFRRYDPRYLVPDRLLEDLYKSVLQERLSQAQSSSGILDIPIVIKRAIPARLTWKVKSEPIIFRIPQVDPDFTIKLYGQDLIFDPPVLTFVKSTEALFRVMGLSLGSKSMIMCRSGANAVKYTGLPSSSPVIVERAFMRHTFQMAFQNHNGMKRRYMFSVDDSLLRHQWVSYLRQHIENATISLKSTSTTTSKFRRAAENIAFRVLQETLIAPPRVSINFTQKPLQRFNGNGGYSITSAGFRFPAERLGRTSDHDDFQLAPLHARSKSRSKVYHQHGAGKNEFDLNRAPSYRGSHEDEETTASPEHDINPRNDGPLWSTRDLELHCGHNSTIVSILFMYLQDGEREKGAS